MSDTPTNAVASTLADPQYKMGRKMIDDGRLEEAVDFFSGLLEQRVAVLSGNEMSPSLAPLYYEYGNSLLYNAEESGAVFGDAITDVEKKRAMAIVEAQMKGPTDDEAETAGGAAAPPEDQEGGAAPEASVDQGAEEDLEIAWMNLEMARRIYSELELTEEIRTAIAKVHLRLGDLNMVNGMYNEAADEFEKCLTHRLALPDPKSRGVADAHVRRAQALFYASTLEGADKDALVGQSLDQYRLAAGIFEFMLAALKAAAKPSTEKENSGDGNSSKSTPAGVSNGKGKGKAKDDKEGYEPPAISNPATTNTRGGTAEELQDVLDAIRETIETMVSGKDMEALAEYKSGAVSTTVGFGDASSSLGSGAAGAGAGAAAPGNGGAEGLTTVGFGAAGTATTTGFGGGISAEGAGVGAGTTATVMVVKRKGRPAQQAVGGEGKEAVTVTDTGGSAKKAKTSEEK